MIECEGMLRLKILNGVPGQQGRFHFQIQSCAAVFFVGKPTLEITGIFVAEPAAAFVGQPGQPAPIIPTALPEAPPTVNPEAAALMAKALTATVGPVAPAQTFQSVAQTGPQAPASVQQGQQSPQSSQTGQVALDPDEDNLDPGAIRSGVLLNTEGMGALKPPVPADPEKPDAPPGKRGVWLIKRIGGKDAVAKLPVGEIIEVMVHATHHSEARKLAADEVERRGKDKKPWISKANGTEIRRLSDATPTNTDVIVRVTEKPAK